MQIGHLVNGDRQHTGAFAPFPTSHRKNKRTLYRFRDRRFFDYTWQGKPALWNRDQLSQRPNEQRVAACSISRFSEGSRAAEVPSSRGPMPSYRDDPTAPAFLARAQLFGDSQVRWLQLSMPDIR
jgi:hypothetical protein